MLVLVPVEVKVNMLHSCDTTSPNTSPSQGRGKSTLISVLRNPSAPLPSNISTVGVDVAEWVMAPPPHILKEVKKGQPLRRVSSGLK